MADPFRSDESTNSKFWIAISVLVLLNLGTFAYFYNTNTHLKQEFNQKTTEIQGALLETDSFAKKTAETLTTTQSTLDKTSAYVADVHQELQEESQSLQKQLEQQGIEFTTNIQKVKTESEQKITTLKETVDKSKTELEQKLKDIKIESADFSGIVETVVKSVVSVQSQGSAGSGVILDDGYIITNSHVVSGLNAQVIDYNGNSYGADVVKRDPEKDLLVLKLSANLPKLPSGNSDLVKVGEKVIAVGSPGGLRFSVTEGIISAMNRQIDNTGQRYIQTDVPINPGNSGGPLINKKGEVIGISAKKFAGYEGLGFAIPVNIAMAFLEDAKNPKE